MNTNPIIAGSLAFLGPSHASELSQFSYVRVIRCGPDSAKVLPVGPDEPEGDEFDIPLAKLRHRVVDNDEASLWPGSYVGRTVAFVHQRGPCTGQWAYGAVSGYVMSPSSPSLDIRIGDDATTFIMDESPRLIKIDHLNYALQLHMGTSATAINGFELVDLQNNALQVFTKRRGGITAVEQLLTSPLVPDERVPLVRPHDLAVVMVRRQLILDFAGQSSKKRTGSVYADPALAQPIQTYTSPSPSPCVTQRPASPASTSSSFSCRLLVNDVADLQRQNLPLRKRGREASASSTSTIDSDTESVPYTRPSKVRRSAFQPSATQQLANSLVVHRSHKGKDPQMLLELVQHSSDTAEFLKTPPVLRGLWGLEFVDGGLTIMHLKHITLMDKMHALAQGVNMTDFSERNQLKPATDPTCRSDVAEALRLLKTFGAYFYNRKTNDVIEAAVKFVDRYARITDRDAIGWTLVAFWISSKLSKFRGLLVCGDEAGAARVKTEFHRNDDDLVTLHDSRRLHRADGGSQSKAHGNAHGASSHNSSSHTNSNVARGRRPPTESTIPRTLRDRLPKDEKTGKTVCLKALSVDGCGGDGRKGCWDPARAHFRPDSTKLPDDAKRLIADRFHGFAPEFADLA